MGCRNDPDDPRKCERCGQFLWVAEDGLYCGECGVTMPCTMRILPREARLGPSGDVPESRARAVGPLV